MQNDKLKFKIFLHTFLIIPCVIFLASVNSVNAQDNGAIVSGPAISAVPAVIDETAKPGDIFNYQVKLANTGQSLGQVYTFVNDIEAEDGRQEYKSNSKLDKGLSLASWCEIKRALTEVAPGGEAVLDLKIEVARAALPGKRHAVISFPLGGNRSAAEAAIDSAGTARVMLNFEVREEIIDKAQVGSFAPAHNIFTEPPAVFLLKVANSGNRDIAPKGRILIYDRRNIEAGSVDIDLSAAPIAPGRTGEARLEWRPEGGLGRFKARLELEYGTAQSRDLSDTVYFWYLPLPFLIGFALALAALFALLVAAIFRRTYKPHAVSSLPLARLGYSPQGENFQGATAVSKKRETQGKGEVIDLRK